MDLQNLHDNHCALAEGGVDHIWRPGNQQPDTI